MKTRIAFFTENDDGDITHIQGSNDDAKALIFGNVDSEGNLAGLFDPENGGVIGSAFYAVKNNTVAVVGSSLSDVCFTSYGLYTVKRRLDRSWLDFARATLGEKNLDVVSSFASGGATTAAISAQVDAALLTNPTWIMGDFGVINAIAAGDSATTIKASVRSIIAKLAARGVNALFLNSSPVVTGHANSSATTAQKQVEVNRDMAIYAEQKGVNIIDVWGATVTPSSTAGVGVATYFQADLIHYSSLGSRLIGGLIATKISPMLQSFPLLPTSAVVYNATNNPSGLSDNPLFIGTAGTNNTSGTITGPVPTGCLLSKSGTWGASLGTSALSSRSDGFGNDWVITVGGAVAEDDRLFMTLVPSAHARVVAGQTVFGVFALSLSTLALLKECQVYITYTKDAVATINTLFEYSTENPAASEFDLTDWTGKTIVTPKITLPAGTYTDLRLIVAPKFRAGSATATIAVGRANICIEA